MKSSISDRFKRIIILMVLIFIIMKIPKPLLLPLVRIGIPGLILFSLWLGWNRFVRRLSEETPKKLAKRSKSLKRRFLG
jgi:hypothetical protein